METATTASNAKPVVEVAAQEVTIEQLQAQLEAMKAAQNNPIDNAVLSIPSTPDAQEEATEVVGTETVEIDQEKKEKLEALFAEMMASPRFWANPKRVERLELALVLPAFDDRSLQQFSISAKNRLTALALEEAIKKNTVPVIPTEEEILALTMKLHQEKQEKEAKKPAKK